MEKIKVVEENAEQLHRELWEWLASGHNRNKTEWPGWKRIEMCIHACFACEIAKHRFQERFPESLNNRSQMCILCPIFEGAECCGFDDYSIYNMWLESRNVDIARHIANLPWKKR